MRVIRKGYYGWRVVAIAAVLFMLVFGCTVSSFSLYVIPVSREFGISRAQMNVAFVLINAGSAIWAPFIGRAIDRFPLRWVMGASALLLGAGFLTLALSQNLWLSMLALGVGVAIGLDGVAMLTLNVLVARWFTYHRARAMTLSITGQALGTIIVPLPTVWLIESFGWRTALVASGIFVGAIALLVAFTIRDRPGADDHEPKGAIDPVNTAAGDDHLASMRELLGLPQFWLVGIGIALTFMISATFAISMVPIGVQVGLTMTQAAFVGSFYAGAALVAKLLLAGFADRVDRTTMIVGCLLAGMPLTLAFTMISGFTPFLVTITLYGLSVGGFAALFPILQVDMFGLRSYGSVRGLMIPIQSTLVALGAYGAGWIFDQTRGYNAMFLVFLAIQAFVIGLFLWARALHRKSRRPAGAPCPA